MADEPPRGACDYGGHAMYQPLLAKLAEARAALSDPRTLAALELAEACERLDGADIWSVHCDVSDDRSRMAGTVRTRAGFRARSAPTLSALILALAGRT